MSKARQTTDSFLFDSDVFEPAADFVRVIHGATFLQPLSSFYTHHHHHLLHYHHYHHYHYHHHHLLCCVQLVELKYLQPLQNYKFKKILRKKNQF